MVGALLSRTFRYDRVLQSSHEFHGSIREHLQQRSLGFDHGCSHRWLHLRGSAVLIRDGGSSIWMVWSTCFLAMTWISVVHGEVFTRIDATRKDTSRESRPRMTWIGELWTRFHKDDADNELIISIT